MLKDKHRVSMLILSIGGHPQDLINLQFEWKMCKYELKYFACATKFMSNAEEL